MTDFIYPLATVILDFICVLICIRLSAANHEPAWLLPAALSLALFLGGVVCLLATVSNAADENLSRVAPYASAYLLLISVLWLMSIIAFASRERRRREANGFRRAYDEAEYVKAGMIPKYRKPPVGGTASGTVKAVDEARRKDEVPAIRQTDRFHEDEVATVRMRRTSFSLKEK